jgi:tyrosyl-tRNA synthetase
MGRKETDEMSAAQIFYPCMQAADVFFLKADICQLGMDQRKVNMLARYTLCTIIIFCAVITLSYQIHS